MNEQAPVKAAKDGIAINVYVQPGASKTAWAGIFGNSIKVRIAAPPVEGQANAAVCRYVADYFGVPKSSATVVRGQTGRNKTIHVAGDSGRLLSRAQALVAEQRALNEGRGI